MIIRTAPRLAALLLLAPAALLPSRAAAQAPAAAVAPPADSVRFIGGGPNATLSRMVVAGNTVYLSGVLGTRAGPGIAEQSTMVMESIRTSLAEVGASMDDVVKCLVFLADLSERPQFNQVWNTFFTTNKPARSAIGVDLGGAKVEVECIAVLPGGA